MIGGNPKVMCSHLDWTYKAAPIHFGYIAEELPVSRYMLDKGFETSFCLASRPLIAHAVNGLDVGCAAVEFNLAANPADRSCQGVFVHKPFVYIPQLFQKLPTGQHLPGIFTEQVQHFVL